MVSSTGMWQPKSNRDIIHFWQCVPVKTHDKHQEILQSLEWVNMPFQSDEHLAISFGTKNIISHMFNT